MLSLKRRESVLGKGRHPAVVSRVQLVPVEPGRVAGEDLLLDDAISLAELFPIRQGESARPRAFCSHRVMRTDRLLGKF